MIRLNVEQIWITFDWQNLENVLLDASDFHLIFEKLE